MNVGRAKSLFYSPRRSFPPFHLVTVLCLLGLLGLKGFGPSRASVFASRRRLAYASDACECSDAAYGGPSYAYGGYNINEEKKSSYQN